MIDCQKCTTPDCNAAGTVRLVKVCGNYFTKADLVRYILKGEQRRQKRRRNEA